jgi:hypothetical protein
VEGAARLRTNLWLNVETRNAPLGEDATDAERIAWLERQLGWLREALSYVPDFVKREVTTAIARAEEGDKAIQETIEADKQRARNRLGRSLARQAIGAVLVGVGLLIGTIGAVN